MITGNTCFPPLPAWVLWTALAALVLAGCGEKKTPRPRSEGASPATAVRSGASKTPDTARTVKVRVLDREEGTPRGGCAVRLFFCPANGPSRVLMRDASTNMEGTAEFKIPESTRLMVRSEFSLEDREVDPIPEGPVEVTLWVRTTFPVTGRVVGPGGEPAAGASVFLAAYKPGRGILAKGALLPGAGLDLESFRRRFGYDLEKEVRTGEDGTFSCTVGTCTTLLATAWAPGLVPADWRFVSFDKEAERFEEARLPLFPAARLRLRCLDARGRPLQQRSFTLRETPVSRCRRPRPEAVFAPYSAILVTNEEGRAETEVPAGLTLVPEGSLLFPEPTGGTGLPDPIRDAPLGTLRLAAGESRALLALPMRTVRLAGRILDTAGKGVSGARLKLPELNNSVVTGTAGGFPAEGGEGRFSLLVPFNVHRRPAYEVRADGFRAARGVLPAPEPGTQAIALEVRLEPAETVQLDTGNRAVDLAVLWREPDLAARGVLAVKGPARVMPGTEDLRTGRRTGPGTFAFRNVEPGTYTPALRRGTANWVVLPPITVAETPDHRHTVDLRDANPLAALATPARGSLAGRVVIPPGTRPHAAVVRLARADLPPAVRNGGMAAGREGRSDVRYARVGMEDGAFRFDDLLPGRYVVEGVVKEWDHRLDSYAEVEVKAGENRVTLAPSPEAPRGAIRVTVRAKIVDKAPAPVPGTALLLADPLGEPLGRAKRADPFSYSDGEGRIRLEGLLPGRYGLTLASSDPPRSLAVLSVEVKPGDTQEVEVLLEAGGKEKPGP